MRPILKTLAITFGVLIALVALAGCAGGVQRTLRVESDPPGALVYLNDQEVGRTPMETSFLWYGTYDVRLRKEGYQTVKARSRVWAPWWQIPPIDLVAEFVPIQLEDRHQLSYQLEPLPEQVEVEPLIARGLELRGMLESSEFTKKPTTKPATKPAN